MIHIFCLERLIVPSPYPCRSLHCLFWHPESITHNRRLMANLTLVSNQLFLGTFIITSSGQKYLHTAKWKLKYKELCSSCICWFPCKRCLYCVRCCAGWLFERHKLYSKFVLEHYFELKLIFFVTVLHWVISLVWSNGHLICNCTR